MDFQQTEPSQMHWTKTLQESFGSYRFRSGHRAGNIGKLVLFLVVLIHSSSSGAARDSSRIEELSQHFQDPSKGMEPWIFVPEDNIKELKLAEHPGLVTLWEAPVRLRRGSGRTARIFLSNGSTQ